MGADVRRGTGAVLAIVASGVCAGLLAASEGLADLVRRSSLSPTNIAGAAPDAGRRAGALSSELADEEGEFADTRLFTLGASRSGGITRNLTARPSGRVGAAPPAMLTPSFALQTYVMTAPEFLSDPAAAVARSIAVGDVSGDGRDDLVFLVVRYAPDLRNDRMDIHAAYQRDDGRLAAAVKIGESVGRPYQLLIADLDRDGVGDIMTATYDGVLMLRSNADGTFTASTTVVGDRHDMVATDVDRDGYLDVLVDTSDTSATVIHGNSLGVIDRVSTLALPASASRTTGDVTGDGLDDLILATIVGRPLQEFRIYPALATGGYAAPVVLSRPLEANPAASLAVGDFNADGRGDLVMDETENGESLHLYLQDSLGNLVPSGDIARRTGGGSLVAADLNRDGRTDLALAHSGWGYVGYYLQTRAGFTVENVIQAYQFQGRENYFAAGDLNHDGCGDLVISRWTQSPVLLYGLGCTRPRISGQDPAIKMEGSGLAAPGSASMPVPLHEGAAGANVGEVNAFRPSRPVRRPVTPTDPGSLQEEDRD